MDDLSSHDDGLLRPRPERRRAPVRAGIALLVVLGIGAWFALGGAHPGAGGGAPPAMPPAAVTVSLPVVRQLPKRLGFLGQFSAVDRVSLRAQVGGLLTEIDFKDGQIVHKGDLLFVIDPRPYEIRLATATAQLQTAVAQEALATAELWRAQQLKQTSFGTAETVDQRQADQRTAAASIAQAKAAIADAQLDLDFCHIRAPFTGRISNHLVSVGDLVTGGRGGIAAEPTLLTTIVSLDPIYIDFDMSEADYLTFARSRGNDTGPVDNRVGISLGGDRGYTRTGTLDFVDNAVDRASGTIHARATVANPGFFLVPGEFARVRMDVGKPATVLMLPDAAIVLDQSQHLVMTVAPDGTVVPKPVELGDLRDGLRIIRAGLSPQDHVIVDGIMHAIPGTKVAPHLVPLPVAIAAPDGGGQG